MSESNSSKILPFFNKRAFRYLAIPGKTPAPELRPQYDDMFRFWHSVWQPTFQELEGVGKLYSDDLLRQDDVHTIQYENKIVGLVTTTQMNLRLDAHAAHSYFKDYPAVTLNQLRERFERVMIVGFLTVHKDWRRTKVGPCISEALMGISVRRFQESDAEVMISISRPDRRTDEICKRYGAACIRTDHRAHNVPVDIVAFYRNQVTQSPVGDSAALVEYLWSRRNAPVERQPGKKTA